MNVPERWLRAWCNPPLSTADVAHRLTMAGLEVEKAGPVAPALDGVVVARIVACTPHPDADRLRVCEVDAGTGTPLSIVCGAPNARAGLVTACALPGAVLPGGMTISATTMRGVRSDGMLCSSRELGLDDAHAGIVELDDAAGRPGEPLHRALGLDEIVYELKVTPNLAHAMSVAGVARELSALTGAPLTAPPLQRPDVTIDDRLPVRIDAPELCGRFSGRIIRGVDPTRPTPAWMRQRLERAGQRSISALVDISNYLMLELGRPSHVFDLARIDGALTVRWGRPGERLELLNGQTVDVGPLHDQPVGVIADDVRVESLAGIMGGESTSVGDGTHDIYVEMAFWWPSAIAGRPRRYRFSTDAAQRFERGVDASTTVEHLDHMTALIQSVCGGRAGPVDDTVLAMPQRPAVTLRMQRLERVSGMRFTVDAVHDILERLGLSPRIDTAGAGSTGEAGGGPGAEGMQGTQGTQEAAPAAVAGDARLVVTPPAARFDLQIEEDLIEEVLRVHGYDRIPVRAPRQSLQMQSPAETLVTPAAIKRRWAGHGYHEVINYSFVADADDRRFANGHEPIRLVNPIADQLDVMRSSLWPGLLGTLAHNVNRRVDRARLFELGRVFHRAPQQPEGPLQLEGIAQPLRFAALAWGAAQPDQWGRARRHVDFHDLKGDLQDAHPELALDFVPEAHPALHPGQTARLDVDGRAVGWLGALHPRLQEALSIDTPVYLLELDADVLQRRALPAPVRPSRFPEAVRDVAWIVADDVAAGQMQSELSRFVREDPATRTVRNLAMFDQYRGKGLEDKEKSLAFRFWLQDTERTLSDDEVDRALGAIIRFAAERFGARLRG